MSRIASRRESVPSVERASDLLHAERRQRVAAPVARGVARRSVGGALSELRHALHQVERARALRNGGGSRVRWRRRRGRRGVLSNARVGGGIHGGGRVFLGRPRVLRCGLGGVRRACVFRRGSRGILVLDDRRRLRTGEHEESREDQRSHPQKLRLHGGSAAYGTNLASGNRPRCLFVTELDSGRHASIERIAIGRDRREAARASLHSYAPPVRALPRLRRESRKVAKNSGKTSFFSIESPPRFPALA